MAESLNFLASGFGLLSFGILLFISGFRSLKEKRLIENTPTSKIRSLAMGLVEVYGEVVALKDKLFKSPFTGTDCVWCRWTVEEYRHSGKSGRWALIKNGLLSGHFFLEDETGAVLVDPSSARIEVPFQFQTISGSFRGELPAQATSFLNSAGISSTGFLGLKKQLKLTEYCLLPGEKIYIMGTADDNPFVEDATSQKNEADIMIQKGKNLYYVSDKPEKEILRRHRWRIIGGLFGGAGLIIIGVVVVVGYFSM